MQSKVTEIAPDTYRISTFHPDYGIQINQFLINDDEPFLMHTGLKRMFQTTLGGVSSIIDPAKLRWIGFSHFESDECGALNELLGGLTRRIARHKRRTIHEIRRQIQQRLRGAVFFTLNIATTVVSVTSLYVPGIFNSCELKPVPAAGEYG